jgi:hypothetical protein
MADETPFFEVTEEQAKEIVDEWVRLYGTRHPDGSISFPRAASQERPQPCDRIVNNGMGEPTECGHPWPCEYHDPPQERPSIDVERRLVGAIEREKRGTVRYPEDIGHDMGMAHAQDIIRRELRSLSPHNREADHEPGPNVVYVERDPRADHDHIYPPHNREAETPEQRRIRNAPEHSEEGMSR